MKTTLRWIAVLILPSVLHASVVRGKVVHNGQPRPGITVALRGGSIGQSNPVRSGGDGLFVLQNIPAGQYTLQVWPGAGAQPMIFTIQVKEPQTDVFPVNLP